MRYYANFFSVALALLTTGLTVNAQNYDNGCKTINSISYCEAVGGITYTGIHGSGSYNDVTLMDAATCKCDTKPQGCGGVMAPLDEQVYSTFQQLIHRAVSLGR